MGAKYLAGDFPPRTRLGEWDRKLVLTVRGAGTVPVNDAVRGAELITEESKHRLLSKLGWGAAGLLALGRSAGAELILSGRGTEACVLCTLGDGKKLMVRCSMIACVELQARSHTNDAREAAAKSAPFAPKTTLTFAIVVGVVGLILLGGFGWWAGVFK